MYKFFLRYLFYNLLYNEFTAKLNKIILNLIKISDENIIDKVIGFKSEQDLTPFNTKIGKKR